MEGGEPLPKKRRIPRRSHPRPAYTLEHEGARSHTRHISRGADEEAIPGV